MNDVVAIAALFGIVCVLVTARRRPAPPQWWERDEQARDRR